MSSAKRSPRLRAPQKLLFVASEMTPLIKTGGLADVAGGLPAALARLGMDVRVLLPAYRDLALAPEDCSIEADFIPPPGMTDARLRAIPEDRCGVGIWLLESPGFSDRPGNPYLDAHGRDWPDNAQRFNRLCRVAARIAAGRAGLAWRPDLVHANDWQTGLTPVWMLLERVERPVLFTIHNLQYRGDFDAGVLPELGLPFWLHHPDALEFHGRIALIKGGLVFADAISTVSPTYAQEIQTPDLGEGLDGLLRHRKAVLHGVLNGIDTAVWDPAVDTHLPAHYTADRLAAKAEVKRALQAEMGLESRDDVPVLGCIARLVPQKGIDLILDILPELMVLPVQLVFLGSGTADMEHRLRQACASVAGQAACRIGFDEGLAHRIEAGADLFLMPSRFEPCGLNQLYSLRYGTPPIVHRCGGLVDSVVDTDDASLANGTATGFQFAPATPMALLDAVRRALKCYNDKTTWHKIVQAAMAQDFSWAHSARRYREIYSQMRATAR
ncbi:MAG TPA: glycogen synthase GlgA [Candidatus Macondimonas sp.]|nr:glycogen synthase GlgA [Candidatus Macondimonas sp.]